MLLISLFNEAPVAESVVADLVSRGVPSESISVICSDESKLTNIPSTLQRETAGQAAEDAAESGSTLAAGTGAAILAGAAATVAGLPVAVVGALAAVAVTGPFAALMLSRGIDDAAADFYDREVGDGKILVAIDNDQADDAVVTSVFTDAGGRTFELPEEA